MLHKMLQLMGVGCHAACHVRTRALPYVDEVVEGNRFSVWFTPRQLSEWPEKTVQKVRW
jgi:hypothetical protein